MMKIIVFEGGAPGRVAVIPGDAPEAELEELLGGETALTPLGRGLMLASRGIYGVPAEGKAFRGERTSKGAEREIPSPAGCSEQSGLCEDEEAERLPVRYGLHRLGRAVDPIAGDCAVVAASPMGELRDIRAGDLGRANGYIWALEELA